VQLDRARVGRYSRAAARWLRLAVPHARPSGVRVFYGHDRIPGPGQPVAGGTAKFQKLAERFPNRPADFSLLYLGSTWLPRDLRLLLWVARRRATPVVVNQSGVAYPGWAGDRTEKINRQFRTALLAADHVVYQSEFCKRSADEWLGEAPHSWEILYNAVDVERFTPGSDPSADRPVLLLAGDQTQAYRLESALQTVALLPDVRLIVSGRLVSSPWPLIHQLKLDGRVEIVGRYAQRDAPELYRRAHLLLHTKVRDPCPTAVIEAMASGLPVVYAASGGTVELVGDKAGIGVDHPDGWERDEPPAAEAFAAAVTELLDARAPYAAAARHRAVDRFALIPWLNRHAELFDELLARADTSARIRATSRTGR
jgi:glycosyltransferase involved in cell wall biosynthesis